MRLASLLQISRYLVKCYMTAVCDQSETTFIQVRHWLAYTARLLEIRSMASSSDFPMQVVTDDKTY
jgi:hypothetical protein